MVAIFNTSDDLLYMLKLLFETHDLLVCTGHVNDLRSGRMDIAAFTTQYQPQVVVYDLPPPFAQQWAFLDHLRTNSPLRGRPFIVTSTNAALARELAGRSESVLQVVGRPFEFDELLRAVKDALPANAP